MSNEVYTIRRCAKAPAALPSLEDAAWKQAEVVELKWVAEESAGPIPQVCCRLLHDDANIYGLYQVKDASRLAVKTGYNAMVCEDSCVEFFFKPQPSTTAGYFNLEMSGNGTHLLYYIRNHVRTATGYVDYTEIPAEDGLKAKTISSLPAIVDPEEFGEKEWFEFFQIPVSMLEKYHGPIGKLGGRTWQGNFYKCGDNLKQPHWLGWRGVKPLNFHLPEYFGTFVFEK